MFFVMVTHMVSYDPLNVIQQTNDAGMKLHLCMHHHTNGIREKGKLQNYDDKTKQLGTT